MSNDTIFDNNATRWVDTWDNAGAVYMYNYLANYNGSIADPGKFIYAQNLNSKDQKYGFDFAYLVPTGTSSPLANTLRVTLLAAINNDTPKK